MRETDGVIRGCVRPPPQPQQLSTRLLDIWEMSHDDKKSLTIHVFVAQ